MTEIRTDSNWRTSPFSQQIYNGMDCCLTMEILDAIGAARNNAPHLGYEFSLAMQAPILDMMQRGFAVDHSQRLLFLGRERTTLAKLTRHLNMLAFAMWERPLNARSTIQLQNFFYNFLKIPPIWTSKKGKRSLSMDRETLEKLLHYYRAAPFISHIMAIRETAKIIEVLESGGDADGRIRSSYNIAGTETGRLSSSSSVFGTGGNLQNITGSLRRIFVADPAYRLCSIDLEQAESREVGWLCGTIFNDWTYLDACETGDLHTLTARLIWPTLPWPEAPAAAKRFASTPFYRDYSYRDMSKRGGHGSNYFGKPFTMARHLKVPTKLMEEFQARYFGAFPAIPRWHRWVAQQLQTTHSLTNAFGLTRLFFDRPNDDTTLRAAIAHSPQSSTAYRTNLGLWRIWRHLPVQVLAQTHDSVTFQYPETADENALVAEALKLMEVRLEHKGRQFIIPGEAKVGWNWGNQSASNPDGLTKWTGPTFHDPRQRSTTATTIYD